VLVAALEKSKNDAKALIKYKTEYQSLESKMKVLVNEIVVLKNKKTNIVIKQNKPQIAKAEAKSNIENVNNPLVVQPKKKLLLNHHYLQKQNRMIFC